MRVIKIKNNTGSPQTWVGKAIGSGEYYQIQSNELDNWQSDQELLTAILSGTAIVSDGNVDFSDQVKGLNWLKDLNESPVKILDAKSNPVSLGISTPSDLGRITRGLCENSGSSNLLVNGSTTPVEFEFKADPSKDIVIEEIKFVITSTYIKTKGDKFLNIDTLTSGVLMSFEYNSGSYVEYDNFQITEDLFRFATFNSPLLFSHVGGSDFLIVSHNFVDNLILRAGSYDKVKVTVRDDIAASAHKYFTCHVYGVKDK